MRKVRVFFNDFLDGGKTHGSIGALIHVTGTPLHEETRNPTRPQDLRYFYIYYMYVMSHLCIRLVFGCSQIGFVHGFDCCKPFAEGIPNFIFRPKFRLAGSCKQLIQILFAFDFLFICVFKGSLLFSKGLTIFC